MKIYYYVSDNGDSSVTPHFCETEELARLKEEWEEEDGYGWGESCVGYIEVAGNNIIPNYGVTVESELKEIDNERKYADNNKDRIKWNERKAILWSMK